MHAEAYGEFVMHQEVVVSPYCAIRALTVHMRVCVE